MARTLVKDLKGKIGSGEQTIKGWVRNVRNHGQISFINLLDRTGSVQVVVTQHNNGQKIGKYDVLSVRGDPRESPAVRTGTPGIEFIAQEYEVITRPEEKYPLEVEPRSTVRLDTELAHRAISLRNIRNHLIFRIQADIVRHFCEYLYAEGFTQIFTPKIVAQVAEGGANMFKLDYFGRAAFLAQSPQLYKQIMVGSGLERVFEVGHVFRAEQHDTNRHLNEYVSLDVEVGFIDTFKDLMDLEELTLQYITGRIQERYGSDLKELFEGAIRTPDKIPRISLTDAIDVIRTRYNYKPNREGDIDPAGERLITRWAQEEHGSSFIFLTHYPTSKRPFYTMPSLDNRSVTESFDLICNGLEITTGGQRIHDYNQLVENIEAEGMTAQGLEGYLEAFRHGMPPHGGMGIGLERLTTRLLGIDNVKYGSLFPRDIKRLEP